MTIKAIETHYAGCRFRSRLEARWAVFFDQIKLPWLYEDQGYVFGEKCWLPSFAYLPDFYFPTLNLWAEVKGDSGRVDFDQLCCAAMELREGYGDNRWNNGESRNGESLMLLGNIPFDDRGWYSHTLLGHHKGNCTLSYFAFFDPSEFSDSTVNIVHIPGEWEMVYDDGGGRFANGDIVNPPLSTWFSAGRRAIVQQRVRNAYVAARSARFEHGETPERPR